MSSIQKYPLITKSYAGILKMFDIMFLLLIIFLISSEIFSIPKESKYVTDLLFIYETIQGIPISEYSSRFTRFTPYFFCQVNHLDYRHQ